MHRPSAFNTGNHTTSQSSETHLKMIRLHALSHLNHLHPMHHACVPWRLVMTDIPSVYYVPQSTMKLLSTTHLKRYNIHLNSQCGPNVLIVPGLPSQVSGVWGNWYGRDGYPAIYLNLGEGNLCCGPNMSTTGRSGPLSQLR